MKKLIAIPAGINVTYNLSEDDVITVPCSETDDIFTTITKCGLAIEEFLFKDGQIEVYSEKYQLAGIIWKESNCEFVNTDLSWIKTIRGDELLFPTLEYASEDCCWVFGNIRALIKFSAVCVHLNTPNLIPGYKWTNKSQIIWLIWLANRIGLKVYGQTEMNK